MGTFSELLDEKARISPERKPGRTWDLSTITPLFAQFDLRHPAQRVISIVGSNGKGTCAYLLNHNLLTKGSTVAMITSPHVSSYRERLLVNGHMLSEEVWTAHFGMIGAENFAHLSYYESIMLVALHIVKSQNLEVLILEAGLGGRLDAINGVDADVLLMTSINLEHTELLGNTLEAILGEKIVVARQSTTVYVDLPELDTSIQRWAQAIGFRRSKGHVPHSIKIPGINPRLISLVNTLLYEQFAWQMVPVAVPYRSQMLNTWPLILDTAHNVPAVQVLCQQIEAAYQIKKWNWYINLQPDRDIQGFFNAIQGHAKQIVFCPAPGLFQPEELPPELREVPYLDVAAACERFRGQPSVVCGSFRVIEVFMQACTRSQHIIS